MTLVKTSVATLLVLVAACGGEFRFDARPETDGGAPADSSVDQTASSICTKDSDCKVSALKCLNSYECVECTANADCAGRPGGSFCRPDTHRCVACVKDADCGRAGLKCEETSRHCIEKCIELGPACTTAGTRCEDGLCRRCERNSDCTVGSNRLCNRPSGQCLECFEDSQCPASKPKCAVNYGVCVECLRAKDCSGAGSVCNPDTNSCMQ